MMVFFRYRIVRRPVCQRVVGAENGKNAAVRPFLPDWGFHRRRICAMLKAKGRCRVCGGDGGSAMNERLQAALAELPFWPNLTEPQRELARRGARLAQYERGALVHGCDGQCLGMIRVQSGRLRACMLSDDGREITLYRLTDGDACVLAAACVIRQITFEVQLVADAPTELLILGAHVFQQLTAENIYVECCMYRLATERFSDVMWAMQQLLFTSFDKRLAQYLWDESGHARAPVRATHEQIARDTGAVRETVTRMLRHFADDGVVSLGRGTVTVTDAQKLRSLAGM